MNKETGMKKEKTFIENQFGTVTNKRVIFFRSKNWFSGGSREDIPLRHVTSVRLDTSRSFLVGIVLLFIGFIMLTTLNVIPAGNSKVDAFWVIGIVCLVSAFFKLWGSPVVVVNTSGQDLNRAIGFPWHHGEANAFVNAIRKQLFVE